MSDCQCSGSGSRLLKEFIGDASSDKVACGSDAACGSSEELFRTDMPPVASMSASLHGTIEAWESTSVVTGTTCSAATTADSFPTCVRPMEGPCECRNLLARICGWWKKEQWLIVIYTYYATSAHKVLPLA